MCKQNNLLQIIAQRQETLGFDTLKELFLRRSRCYDCHLLMYYKKNPNYVLYEGLNPFLLSDWNKEDDESACLPVIEVRAVVQVEIFHWFDTLKNPYKAACDRDLTLAQVRDDLVGIFGADIKDDDVTIEVIFGGGYYQLIDPSDENKIRLQYYNTPTLQVNLARTEDNTNIKIITNIAAQQVHETATTAPNSPDYDYDEISSPGVADNISSGIGSPNSAGPDGDTLGRSHNFDDSADMSGQSAHGQSETQRTQEEKQVEWQNEAELQTETPVIDCEINENKKDVNMKNNDIRFEISYLVGNNSSTFEITIDKNSTVFDIKKLIEKKINVPPDLQVLHSDKGWLEDNSEQLGNENISRQLAVSKRVP